MAGEADELPKVLSTRHTPSTAAGTRGRPSSRSWTGGWGGRHRGGRRGDEDRRRGGHAGRQDPQRGGYPTPASPVRLRRHREGRLEVKDGFEVDGVCVAVAGLVLADENKVIFAPNLHAIEDIPLNEGAGAEDRPLVTVENDANAATWGEFRFGAGKEVDHLVFVAVGTGIGGGVISHRMLLRGAQGSGRARTRHHRGHRPTLRLRQPRLPRGPRLRDCHRPPGPGAGQRKSRLRLGSPRSRPESARGGCDAPRPRG